MQYLPEDFPAITGPETVAKVLGFSSETIRRRARQRDGSVPPAFSIGNGPRSRLRFRREDVEAWLAAQLAPQKKSGTSALDAA